MLQCTAGTLRRRRHSRSTWTVLQILFSFEPARQCSLVWYWDVTCCKHFNRPIGTSTGCWPRLIVPERPSFCSLGTVAISIWRCTSFSGWWRMVTHLAPCDRVVIATGLLPAMGRGTRHLATNVTVLLRMLTPSGTLYFSEFGHVNKYLWVDSEKLVSLQCIINATICCLAGNHAVACLTILGVIIRLLHVFVL